MRERNREKGLGNKTQIEKEKEIVIIAEEDEEVNNKRSKFDKVLGMSLY